MCRLSVPGAGDRADRTAVFRLSLIHIFLIFFQKDRENEPQLSRDELSAIAKLAVLLVVYMLGLKYLGFLVITPIVLLVLSYMFTFGKPMALWKHLLYTVCVTGAPSACRR